MVDKPAGLPSTGRDLDDPACVQGWLMETLGRRKIWAVHQLDRDTTGLNLFVTKKPLVARLSETLRAGTKTYLALSGGPGFHGERTVTVPIGRRRVGRRWLPALGGAPGVEQEKAALSSVRTVSASTQGSLLRVRIETGRSHQVRLHLLSLGHPICGESQHLQPPDSSAPRLLLHAWTLDLPGVPEPLRGLRSPLPADFRAALRARGLRLPERDRDDLPAPASPGSP